MSAGFTNNVSSSLRMRPSNGPCERVRHLEPPEWLFNAFLARRPKRIWHPRIDPMASGHIRHRAR